MGSMSIHRAATVLLAISSSGPITFAQPQSTTPAIVGSTTTSSTAPSISIELHQNDKTATAPFDVYVSATNLTARRYVLHRVDLVFPAALMQTRGPLPQTDVSTALSEDEVSTVRLIGESGSKPTTPRGGPAQIDGYSSVYYHYPFRRYGRGLWHLLTDRHTFLFLADTYRVFCIVEYEAHDPNGAVSSGFARGEVAVEFTPPLNSIVRGGIFGAALLALFVTMYRGSRMV
jgi:hypothetical protein